MLVTTRMIFFLSMLIRGPPAAGAFVCLASSTLKGAAMETKVSCSRRFLGSATSRRQTSLARNRVMDMQAEGSHPAAKNIFDYIVEEDIETLRKYVDGGGQVHVADALGDTAMLVAAGTGNAEVVKTLTRAKDADVNYPCFHGGETPLMVACTHGYLAVAECLVREAGAKVNVTNHRGDTALSLAAFWGKVDCLKFLLSMPDINTEIENVQGKRAGEDMHELMRDDTNDAETLALLRASRAQRGFA